MSLDKLSGVDELAALRKSAYEKLTAKKTRVLLCMTGCRAKGAVPLGRAFRKKIQDAGLSDEVDVVDVGCHGQCSRAPLVLIEPQGYLYGGAVPEDVDEIIETTIRGGKPVERLCTLPDGAVGPAPEDVAFYRNQRREVLKHCGRIDPREIEQAIAVGTYEAAAQAIATMSPEDVIDLVKQSGLRGRGGAGFPTGTKWTFTRKAEGDEKYLICNADEGDPGAFMDRALLEGVPHQVVEGMLIAAYAVGASHGFIYVRAEYPIAVEHITRALMQAQEIGLLGDRILGTDFSFHITVRMGAGAFVCGEETALIASLEGRRGMPRPRPPFPANSGFRGKPTNINNVETLANVPLIVRNGHEWFTGIGTDGSKGTKIFALAGTVKDSGLVEVPMGATLRNIVFEVGGGPPDGRTFKAAQIGGPSGGCVPAQYLDLPIDYDSVKEVGAIMGSGGLVVMDDKTCMVDVARFFQEFTQKESCGKCVPCRVGTRHLVDILTRICEGEGKLGDLRELEALAQDVKAGSLCGLGQTAANPVLTTLRFFRDEYEAHIKEKRCPAGSCKALITYRIDPETCIGCTKCARACPVNVIAGEPKAPHTIDVSGCIRCGACQDVCPVDAVYVQ
jgi:NADH:ubiquinone oxidoreductase subunit F (NADH-binding)/(2Fe-2S) ferredoxin